MTLFSVLLFGCGQRGERFLVLLPSTADMRYEELQNAAKEWAAENDVLLEVRAPKIPGAAEQQQILEEALREEWSVICVEPMGNMELAPLLEHAQDRGTRIITMRGEIACADYNIEPFSNAQLGKRMMDTLAQQMRGEGQYITVASSGKGNDTVEIEAAAADRQKEKYGNMLASSRMGEAGTGQSGVKSAVEEAVNEHQAAGVMFFNTNDGLEAAKALRTQHGVAAVGLGDEALLEGMLEEGTVDSVFSWSRTNLLLAALQIGKLDLSGKQPETDGRIVLPYEGYETLRHVDGNTWQADDIRERQLL